MIFQKSNKQLYLEFGAIVDEDVEFSGVYVSFT